MDTSFIKDSFIKSNIFKEAIDKIGKADVDFRKAHDSNKQRSFINKIIKLKLKYYDSRIESFEKLQKVINRDKKARIADLKSDGKDINDDEILSKLDVLQNEIANTTEKINNHKQILEQNKNKIPENIRIASLDDIEAFISNDKQDYEKKMSKDVLKTTTDVENTPPEDLPGNDKETIQGHNPRFPGFGEPDSYEEFNEPKDSDISFDPNDENEPMNQPIDSNIQNLETQTSPNLFRPQKSAMDIIANNPSRAYKYMENLFNNDKQSFEEMDPQSKKQILNSIAKDPNTSFNYIHKILNDDFSKSPQELINSLIGSKYEKYIPSEYRTKKTDILSDISNQPTEKDITSPTDKDIQNQTTDVDISQKTTQDIHNITTQDANNNGIDDNIEKAEQQLSNDADKPESAPESAAGIANVNPKTNQISRNRQAQIKKDIEFLTDNQDMRKLFDKYKILDDFNKYKNKITSLLGGSKNSSQIESNYNRIMDLVYRTMVTPSGNKTKDAETNHPWSNRVTSTIQSYEDKNNELKNQLNSITDEKEKQRLQKRIKTNERLIKTIYDKHFNSLNRATKKNNKGKPVEPAAVVEPEPVVEPAAVVEPEPVVEPAANEKPIKTKSKKTKKEPVAEPAAVVEPEPAAVVEPEPAAVVEPEPTVVEPEINEPVGEPEPTNTTTQEPVDQKSTDSTSTIVKPVQQKKSTEPNKLPTFSSQGKDLEPIKHENFKVGNRNYRLVKLEGTDKYNIWDDHSNQYLSKNMPITAENMRKVFNEFVMRAMKMDPSINPRNKEMFMQNLKQEYDQKVNKLILSDRQNMDNVAE